MQKDKQFIVTCSAYLTAMLLLFVVQILASLGCFSSWSDQTLEVLFSIVPQILIMFLIPFTFFWIWQKRQHQPQPITTLCREIGWQRISLRKVLLAFCLGVCLYILNVFVASFFASILQAFGYQYTSHPNVFHGRSGLLLALLLTAVLPGFCEEFLHRGILLSGFVKKFGVYKAVMLVSLLFGLMHLNVAQFFFATVLGWFLCLAVLTSKSLWVGMIIHFTNNALSVYLSYADELNLPGADFLNTILSTPLFLILTLILVVIAIGEILRSLARENFQRHQDLYTVRYLAAQREFSPENFDQVKTALAKVIQNMPTWKATFAYIETYERPQRLRPLERALLTAILVLGSTITVLTFIWGTW